jgi:hypothetical protein
MNISKMNVFLLIYIYIYIYLYKLKYYISNLNQDLFKNKYLRAKNKYKVVLLINSLWYNNQFTFYIK